jgi:gamma-glutamyltranspeptidase/glutathione hydrolase
MDVLLSPEYNRNRSKLVGDNASLELIPGDVPGYGGEVTFKTYEELVASGIVTFGPPSGDTTHFDVIDRWGNMVSATPSGGWLQRSPTIPSLGFCLGTRGQMFWLKKGLPGSIAPRKRPRTTLSPNLAFKDGRPYLAFGTPGGDKQDQWSLSFFLRHVHHGMNLQEAIDAPQFHTGHFPDSFYPRASNPGHLSVEGRTSRSTIDELRRRGHRLEVSGDWSQGRFAATATENGILRAAVHQRFMEGFGSAVGR